MCEVDYSAISNEVTNSIVGSDLIENGWTTVVVNHWENIDQQWLDDNLPGKHAYTCFGYYWYFENKSDAMTFALRWK